MKIEPFIPSPALSPFIRSFLIIGSDLGMTNTIIPDAGIVLSFRYKGSILGKDEGDEQTLPSSLIAGLRRSPRLLRYAGDTANLLVVFREGGISAFSRLPAHELYEQRVSSHDIFGGVEEVLDRMSAAGNNRERIDIVETFLLHMLRRRDAHPDLLIADAVQRIRTHHGMVRIRELAGSLFISQDAFEKRFRAAVGASPKQYASIIRLRQLIGNYSDDASLTDAAYAAGYFDQSHFIRDFRTFTGQTPKDFFKTGQYW